MGKPTSARIRLISCARSGVVAVLLITACATPDYARVRDVSVTRITVGAMRGGSDALQLWSMLSNPHAHPVPVVVRCGRHRVEETLPPRSDTRIPVFLGFADSSWVDAGRSWDCSVRRRGNPGQLIARWRQNVSAVGPWGGLVSTAAASPASLRYDTTQTAHKGNAKAKSPSSGGEQGAAEE